MNCIHTSFNLVKWKIIKESRNTKYCSFQKYVCNLFFFSFFFKNGMPYVWTNKEKRNRLLLPLWMGKNGNMQRTVRRQTNTSIYHNANQFEIIYSISIAWILLVTLAIRYIWTFLFFSLRIRDKSICNRLKAIKVWLSSNLLKQEKKLYHKT